MIIALHFLTTNGTHQVNAGSKPSVEEINSTRAEYEKLFSAKEPVGDTITIHADAAVKINNDPPTEMEVVESS